MRKLITICAIATTVLAIGSTAFAGLSWQTTPILGYDSEYTGNVVIITTTGPVVVPFDDPDGIVTTGTSMTVFSVGQEIHSGSGIFLDAGQTYSWTSAFTDLTDSSRSVSYSGSYTPGDAFFMVWNTPTGSGDGLGVSTLTTADIGLWHYTETWTDLATNGPIISSTASFEVVPEPATICLLGLGALSLLRKKRLA